MDIGPQSGGFADETCSSNVRATSQHVRLSARPACEHQEVCGRAGAAHTLAGGAAAVLLP